MIQKLTLIFLLTMLIWFAGCSVMWVIGSYLHCYFDACSYTPRWEDAKSSFKISLVVSLAYTFLAWINVLRKI
ncbi:hypothetical protein FHW67_004268 [Herbaspirillum sp. Sphag1AN]|nr:hypothetical protein [Herbaspirillum sp. Sphag1AN]MBB3248131.1 hypothetical protein [Herbaspirillum sp. Sphag64]